MKTSHFTWIGLTTLCIVLVSPRAYTEPVSPAPSKGVLDAKALMARETFWDNRDFDWFADHVPVFECPDADIQTTWYYRWELLKGWAFGKRLRFHRVSRPSILVRSLRRD